MRGLCSADPTQDTRHTVGRTDFIAPTRHPELDPTDQGLYPSALKDLGHRAGIDDLSGVGI